MIDITKMKLTVKNNPKWVSKMTDKLSLVNTNGNWKNQYYEGTLYFNEDKTEDSFDDDRYLELHVTDTSTHITITLTHSIRDWYFGRNSSENFTIQSFKGCLDLLAEKLSIPKMYVSNASIMEISWELKIGFEKQYSNFMNCILEHKKLKNKSIIGKSLIKFYGNEKKLIIKKEKMQFSINTDYSFYVNFTIAVNNINNNDFLKYNANCPKDVLQNWTEFANEWKKELDNLIILNSYSSKICNYLSNSNMTKMNGYLIYVAIKHYGLEQFRTMMNDKMTAKKLYEYRKNYKEIYEKFEGMNSPNYESYFRSEVQQIIELQQK